MANSSELLHFLKHDVELCAASSSGMNNAQDKLAEAVQLAFRHLVLCMQNELSAKLPAMLADTDAFDDDIGEYLQGN